MMQSQDGQAKIKRGRQARNTGTSQLANEHIGERIRLRRTLLGLSQLGLGKALGLSFQQMQKYERGASAIGAGQLCGIARALDVPVSFFYDGLDGVSVPPSSDGRERQDRLVRDELEVLGHYRAAPGFIQDAIRSLLGYLSNQDPGHNRGFARGAAAKQADPADSMSQAPSRDDAVPYRAGNEFPDDDADAEIIQPVAGGMPESALPELDQDRSAPAEQPIPARRPRGRPRKAGHGKTVETAQAEPPSMHATPVESADQPAAASDMPQPDRRDGTKKTIGAKSAGRPPASGKTEPNRRSPRRSYGATWSPSDIDK